MVDTATWPSKKGLVAIKDMQLNHLVAAIQYVERKAKWATQQILFVSGVVHVDLVSMIPDEKALRAVIAPQYPALREELDRRAAGSRELREHLANGCDDHKCPVVGCPNGPVEAASK